MEQRKRLRKLKGMERKVKEGREKREEKKRGGEGREKGRKLGIWKG